MPRKTRFRAREHASGSRASMRPRPDAAENASIQDHIDEWLVLQ